VKHPRE